MTSDARETRGSNPFMSVFEDLLRIIRDYGIPTAAFGAGIFGFFLLLYQTDLDVVYKLALSGILAVVGIMSQLWVFSRENPRIHSDEYTRLVEKMIDQNMKYVDLLSHTQNVLIESSLTQTALIEKIQGTRSE